MKLKCIETKGAHWGLFFKEDEWYETSRIYYRDYDIITDTTKYYEFITNFLSEARIYRKLETEEERIKLQAVNEKYKVNPYQKKVSVNMCEIYGLDKQNHIFCIENKSDIKKKYGTSEFVTSVEYIEDTFVNVDFIRNEFINRILS